MTCEKAGEVMQKLDPSSFKLELFFVCTQKYVDTYCICLSNYITPNTDKPPDQIPQEHYLGNHEGASGTRVHSNRCVSLLQYALC